MTRVSIVRILKNILASTIIYATFCALLLAEEGTDAHQDHASRKFKIASPLVQLTFPRDHGRHQDYKTEWWYFTGHLRTEKKQTFGFELTFFRVASPTTQRSDWSFNNVYLAHFALTDDGSKSFQHWSKHSRDSYGLAGASETGLKVWVNNWSVTQDGERIRLSVFVDEGELNLSLLPKKPLILHGENGYSRKGTHEDEASMYYSMTRLGGNGKLVVGGVPYEISSASAWMDHEFFSSSEVKGSKGWDWFAIQLENGDDVMLYSLRDEKGNRTSYSAGSYVRSDGSIERLSAKDFTIEPINWWSSPHTGTKYPSGWNVTVKGHSLRIIPTVTEQELLGDSLSRISYWEGRSTVSGSTRGEAYVELVGY